MKKYLLLFVLFPAFCFSQIEKRTLPLHYSIYATLNNDEKTITAFEKIGYKNNTSQPQSYIWIRLYPNAYANDRTAYSEYLLKQNDLRFYFSGEEKKGYINQLNFQENGTSLKTEFDSAKNDLIKLYLSSPLVPGDSVEIETPFFIKIPYNFSGFGYNDDDEIQLTHWFVEVAYEDENGWDLNSFSSYSTIKGEDANFDIHFCSTNNLPIKSNAKQVDKTFQNNQYTYIFNVKNVDNVWLSQRSEDDETISTTEENSFDKLVPDFVQNKRPDNNIAAQQSILRKINGVDSSSTRPLKPAFLFNLKETDKYRYLSFLPSAGYNNYDKFMIGAMVHNYQLPLNKFNFLIAPMYATNSKTFAGVARLEYNIWHPNQWWQFTVSGERFSMNSLTLNSDAPVFLQVNKLVPSVSYTKYYGENEPYKKWNFLLRAFILGQDNFTYPLVNDSTYTVAKKSETKTIVEFQTTLKDERALYPYNMNFKIDGDKDFLRLGFTGNYFLNYDASGKGLNVRLFAGKFIYLNDKSKYGLNNLNLNPYFLSLSGLNGSQDFTYSNYFVGRNETTGWMSQQIMQSDGFFKVSTPQLAAPIGISDNWIGALNFTADIPDKINPFSVLPFRVPLRIFFDVGSYSEAWEDNAQSGKYLYDAGLQLSVLRDAVTVYFPFLYSKVYKDNYTSIYPQKRFVHTISFSINLENLKPKVLNKILPL